MAVALVVAAGRGERLGSAGPKALVELAGRPMLAWSLDALRASAAIERIVVALPAGVELPPGCGPEPDHAAAGGPGRRALARSDFPAAANLLDRAARVLDEHNGERARLLVAAGEAYLEIGEFTKTDGVLVQAQSSPTTSATARS